MEIDGSDELLSISNSFKNVQIMNYPQCHECNKDITSANGGNCHRCNKILCRLSSCSFYSSKLNQLFCYDCWLKDKDYWSWFNQSINNDLIIQLQKKFNKPYLHPPPESKNWSYTDLNNFFESEGRYKPNLMNTD